MTRHMTRCPSAVAQQMTRHMTRCPSEAAHQMNSRPSTAAQQVTRCQDDQVAQQQVACGQQVNRGCQSSLREEGPLRACSIAPR